MHVKDNTVNIVDLAPQLVMLLPVIDQIYHDEYNTELVITSGKDGIHKQGSLHYEGKAVDLRIWNIWDSLIARLKKELGPDFDVVLEKDHIHLEWDPKHDKKIGK